MVSHSLWRTTQVCHVPSRSHTWRFHRSGRGCHMVPSPWERRSFHAPRRGCCEENEFGKPCPGRSLWRDQQDLLLVLPDLAVYASRLIGANAYLRKASCVPVPPQYKYSWQREDSREANRSTWAFPNRLQISRILSGWSRHSLGNVSCHEKASAAGLSSPGMWTAGSDLSCVWLQRRRWRWTVTCGMIVDLPASWCMRQPQCCPYGPTHAWLTAVAGTASRLDALPAALGSWFAKAVEAPSRDPRLPARCM